MRIFSLFLLPAVALAFSGPAPVLKTSSSSTALAMNRRDVMGAIFGGASLVAASQVTNAFSQQLPDHDVEPAQQATSGLVDLNAAFVGEYKQFRGMFPHAAGKIASHGPYLKVKDIYKIPDLSEHDVAMFKKYEDEFTTNPPGRAFKERINARVST